MKYPFCTILQDKFMKRCQQQPNRSIETMVTLVSGFAYDTNQVGCGWRIASA